MSEARSQTAHPLGRRVGSLARFAHALLAGKVGVVGRVDARGELELDEARHEAAVAEADAVRPALARREAELAGAHVHGAVLELIRGPRDAHVDLALLAVVRHDAHDRVGALREVVLADVLAEALTGREKGDG